MEKGIPVDKTGMYLRNNYKYFTRNEEFTKKLYLTLRKTHNKDWKSWIDLLNSEK